MKAASYDKRACDRCCNTKYGFSAPYRVYPSPSWIEDWVLDRVELNDYIYYMTGGCYGCASDAKEMCGELGWLLFKLGVYQANL